MEQLTTRCSCRRVAGFTLVELLVTISVIALLLTLAVPSYVTLSLNQVVRGAAGDLQTSLFFARSEAKRRADAIRIHTERLDAVDEKGGAQNVVPTA